MSNFYFLKDKWKTLYKLGKQSEEQCFIDNNISILKSRIFNEQLTKLILIKLKKDYNNLTQYECIQLIRKEFDERHFSQAIPNVLDTVRLYGNKAAHEGFGNPKVAKVCIENMVKASAWLYANVTKDKSILPIKFDNSFLGTGSVAAKIDIKQEEAVVNSEIDKDADSLKKETEENKVSLAQEENENKEIQNKLDLTEKETRIELIDAEIREAGWNLDDEKEVKREYLIVFALPERPKVSHKERPNRSNIETTLKKKRLFF
jgi:type I restriction enzyme R subunit